MLLPFIFNLLLFFRAKVNVTFQSNKFDKFNFNWFSVLTLTLSRCLILLFALLYKQVFE